MRYIDWAITTFVRHAASVTSIGRGNAKLLILTYHRILPMRDHFLPGTIDKFIFDLHMKTLARFFRPLPLEDAVDRLALGNLPSRSVCVTFDDGYADNYDVALPILNKYNIPATVFVAVGYLDGGRMWNDTVIESIRRVTTSTLRLPELDLPVLTTADESERGFAVEAVISKLRRMGPDDRQRHTDSIAQQIDADLPSDLMLSTEKLVLLHEAGIEIGAHTISHPILSRLSHDDAVNEIRGSREQLEEILGTKTNGFAYPNGVPGVDYTKDHRNAVVEAGYKYAVSTASGASSNRSDVFQLPRFGPWDDRELKLGLRLAREYSRTQSQSV